MGKIEKKIERLDWIDSLKAFAIIGILLNHAVESFRSYPWFSNPSESWLPFAERMSNLFPKDGSIILRLIQFLGWLGDMGPGIFILVSGLTLTISAFNKPFNKIDFYKKRALRIYPLYITIHLITIVVAVLYFHWNINPKSAIQSMLGLRFTDSLFWYLNPSWWFIWLIIQFYIVFPLLFNILKKYGPKYFLILTLVITLISRTSGVLGYTFGVDLEKWMTGLFAGTRLFEFTFGMFVGFLIQTKNFRLTQILNDKIKFSAFSVFIYIVGFIASWTYFGSIFSNFLITIGLSGIFYSAYELIFRGSKTMEAPILWIGRNSFSAFLIHQSFMRYYSSVLTGYSKTVALVVIIIASFVAGYLIEKLVNKTLPYIITGYSSIVTFIRSKIGTILSIILIAGVSFLSFVYLLGIFGHSKIIFLSYLFLFSYLSFYRLFATPHLKSGIYRYFDIALIISFLVLIFRGTWLSLFGLLILVSYVLFLMLKKINHRTALLIVISVLILGFGSIEFYLMKYKPVETESWGELPALKIDSETVYSLIPNKLTHLRYNNYNYFVKTNSMGFTSPEINFPNKDLNELYIMVVGDAFSMPEGMNYNFSYPAILENKLRAQFPEKKIHVINAGVTGYGPNEEYAQLEKYINTIKPDIVINQLFINEFLEINISRKVRLENIGLIEKNRKEKRLREKLNALGDFQFTNHLSLFFKNISGNNDDFNYNKSLLYLYEKNSSLYSDSVVTKMNNFLLEMNDLCKKNKSEYIVLGVPGQIEVSEPKYITYFPHTVNLNDTTKFDFDLPLHILHNLCNGNDITYLDSKFILRKYPEQPVYFEKSWHWNKKGHSVIADYLFEFIKNDTIFN